MTPFKLATALATLLLVAGCTVANAEDATTTTTTTTTTTATPAYGPGWRHEQMMQARGQGRMPAMMMAANGQGQGWGFHRGGPPLKADGTIDTAKLPDWCPMKTGAPQTPQTK